MIKIDWEEFITDYVWFGWYYNPVRIDYADNDNPGWSYSKFWNDRLCPMQKAVWYWSETYDG